jgi:hypothetical protein
VGKIYQRIIDHLPEKVKGVFVEIGSDRGEGSTVLLDKWAGQAGTKLITVDILSNSKNRLEGSLTNTEFVVAQGSTWAKDFASSWTDIAVLYLDNFDYIWDINNVSPAIQMQMQEYARQGVTMTNQNCQIEHMRQIMTLHHSLHKDSIVVFDDTYAYNDCWIGKCGPAVVFLLAHGWAVVDQTLDCGVILKKLDNSL